MNASLLIKHRSKRLACDRMHPYGQENKCQLMTKSRLRDGTEPAVFIPEVAKQHDVSSGAIAFLVLVSARASF